MIALIASALLGLYVFLPVFIFDKCAAPFVRLKRHQRAKTEEVVVGILVAGLPFFVTLFLSHYSHFIGHWPFRMSDAEAVLKISDYKTVFNSLYSEHYFDNHISQFWDSFGRVFWHQFRFLLWNIFFLSCEIGLVVTATMMFGRLHQRAWFRLTVGKFLLKRVSEWEPLLTTFVFHPDEQRSVEVDLMTTDNHLYRGTIETHFLGGDGELRGLLLKNAKRFKYSQLVEERKAGKAKPIDQYWQEIPGSNMYIAYDKTVTLNLRYELSKPELLKKLQSKIVSMTGIPNIVVEKKLPGAEPTPPADPQVP